VSYTPPSAAEHLAFLAQVERLLREGRFTSTYKFALLLALLNIAVEKGDDSGQPLKVDLDEIARQFISIYWGMARPYPRLNTVLKQNLDARAPARMITLIGQQSRHAESQWRRWREYQGDMERLLRDTRKTMAKDVLYRLQTVGRTGGERSAQFIYSHPADAHRWTRQKSITLRAGVAASMRHLRSVIASMVQARWARWVRDNNQILGPDRSLDEFLFGAERTNVARYAKRLHALQGGRCFYSGTRLTLGATGNAEVDHFIPWARYPFDSPFNLVLASGRVNQRMRDDLKPVDLRRRWLARNDEHFDQLVASEPQGFGANKADHETARAVAHWVYETAEAD